MKALFFLFFWISLLFPCHSAEPAPPPLQVEIVPPRPPKENGEPVVLSALTVRFTNTSDSTVRIIRPLDGSTDGRIAPFYRITTKDSKGIITPEGPSCGNFGLWASTKWPGDYVIMIPPGHTHEVPVSLHLQLAAGMPYTFAFEYAMPAQVQPDTNALGSTSLRYPENVWRGTIQAKEITFQHGSKNK